MADITGISLQLPIGVLTSLLAFNIILSFIASLGNVLILLTIYKVSSLHPVTKLLFACLATTDLCVGLFSQPLFVANIILNIDLANTDLDLLYHLSRVVYISSYVLCGVSVLTSTAISVDRLLVLLLRLKYRQVVKRRLSEASSSCYTFLLGNCCFMWIGSRLESNDFTDFRFNDRIGFFSYFRVLLRKDLPETTGESGCSRRELWGWTVKRR